MVRNGNYNQTLKRVYTYTHNQMNSSITEMASLKLDQSSANDVIYFMKLF